VNRADTGRPRTALGRTALLSTGARTDRTDDPELRLAARRLAMQFTGLIVVLLLLVGGLVLGIVSAGQQEASDQELRNSASIDSPDEAPDGVYLIVVDDGRLRTSRDLPAQLPDEDALRSVAETGKSVESSVRIDGHDYRVLTSQDGPHLTQVAVDQHQRDEERGRLILALSVSGILAAVAAWFLATWMARRAMQPLAEALALQRRFVADASHELRTPLTVLSTRAQMLRRRLPALTGPDHDGAPGASAQIRGQVDEIVQDSRMLTEILEDLLIAADPREVLEQQPLDIAALADEAVASLRPAAEHQNLTLERTGSAAPVMVNGARIALHRLFTALVSNAVDHAVHSVQVDVQIVGANAVIRVSDDGPGFPAGTDARAFERFASTRAGAPAGAGDASESAAADADAAAPRHYGLGLALVAEVAARHGGSVSIEPLSGRGATVAVFLPARR
jgi:two-component system OmpR family sensor kinase